MENLPIYVFEYDEDEEHFTTALVKDPAVEKTLSLFKDEKPAFFANEEKRIIYAVAMEPMKMIFRNAKNDLPDLLGYFTKESIEKFQLNYAKFKGQDRTNISHVEKPIDGVYMFENWIVKDPEMDKSKLLGIDAKEGSLIQGFKIENEEVWQQCKSGDLDGLSIEAYLKPKLVSNFKTEIMNKLEVFKKFLKEHFADEVVEDEMMKDDKDKMAEHDDKDKMAEHDDKMEDKMEEHTEVDHAADMDAMKAKLAELEVKIADMAADKVKDETTLTSMKSELEKFKLKTPASKSIVNLPKEAVKSYAEMSNFEKMKFNKQK